MFDLNLWCRAILTVVGCGVPGPVMAKLWAELDVARSEPSSQLQGASSSGCGQWRQLGSVSAHNAVFDYSTYHRSSYLMRSAGAKHRTLLAGGALARGQLAPAFGKGSSIVVNKVDLLVTDWD